MFYSLPNEFVADLVKEYLQLLANVKKSKSEIPFSILLTVKDNKTDEFLQCIWHKYTTLTDSL